MYYSSGNYEAFAHPKKPEGVDNKSAYLIGSGLAALTAACYLVRDGQMQGDHIHVFEKDPLPGGACDGYKYDIGYVMRGGREMDNHFEVMWDLLRSIPSLETEGASVLDEYYWLNKEDPNKSLCRATVNRGQDAHTDGKFAISDQGAMEIMKLFFTPDEQLQDKKITDIFDDEVFSSNFWMYWRTMFAFENWHSALEMKLYLKRYIHHIGGLPDFTALRFTRYNQYESIILPMVTYLKDHGVDFQYETKVTDVQFRIEGGKKQASSVTVDHKGESRIIDLTENDLLFITNGGCVESCTIGSQDKAAGFDPTIRPGNGWDLWKKIAAQDPSFGHPEKFCSQPELSNWESATITTLDDMHLFIVSEDTSLVPFKVRKKLITEGTAQLDNICYHDSGPYIISNATFPSYFQKDENAVIESHALLDLTVFTKIARTLGISRRYVGEEPTSLVTGIYNQIMSEKLPENDIECVIVPRKTDGEKAISASTVRQAIKDNDMDTLKKLVPESTLRYFESEEANEVIARIRNEENVVHY